MKDLLVKIVKSIAEALFKVALDAVKNIDYKKVAYKSYVEFKPSLKKKVDDSESKIDDTVLIAMDKIVDTFLKPEEKSVS